LSEVEAEALRQGSVGYVHGYSEREAQRLLDQAYSVRDLLHNDSRFPVGSRVLELGCGIGAQTVTLASNSPGALFLSCDVATGSLEIAAERTQGLGLDNVCLLCADLYELPFASTTFDSVFICHVLEHLKDPAGALRSLLRVVQPGGSVTVIEGDHGSCYFHPTSDEAIQAWRCLIRVQAGLGGDSLIGRRLYSVMTEAGGVDPVVSPRMVYADRSRPEVMDAFVAKTIIPMVEGVEEEALDRGYMTASAWKKGLDDLRGIVLSDVGVFCYTFFKAVATVGPRSALKELSGNPNE
jgi:SAM-dependent methyltransferase